MKMAIKEVTLKRRNPKNLGGRPTLEEVDYLTPEYEDVAQFTRAGFTSSEIADEMKCSTERITRILQNPLVQARVKRLQGDRLVQIALSRDRLWDAAVESAIRQLHGDELPVSELADILQRYDPYHRIEMMITKEEKRLLVDARKSGKGHLLGSGRQTASGDEVEDVEEGTIFGILNVEEEER